MSGQWQRMYDNGESPTDVPLSGGQTLAQAQLWFQFVLEAHKDPNNFRILDSLLECYVSGYQAGREGKLVDCPPTYGSWTNQGVR